MITIVLSKHEEVDKRGPEYIEMIQTGNYSNLKLTAKGEKESCRIPRLLEPYQPFKRIIVTGDSHTRKTAQPSADFFNLELEEVPGLSGIKIEPGDASAEYSRNIIKGKLHFYEWWFNGSKGLEKPETYWSRTLKGFYALAMKYRGETIPIFGDNEHFWILETLRLNRPFGIIVRTTDMPYGYKSLRAYTITPGPKGIFGVQLAFN